MADRVIKEIMNFPFEFIAPVTVDIEETSQGVAIIKGTLLAEGVSGNGNLYTIEEMGKIAKQAEGQPIYVGVMTKMDPNLGIMRKNLHANIKRHRVGRILKAWYEKASRTIKYVAELVNSKLHPKIIEEVKTGWGVSIGGVAHKAKLILDSFGRLLTKILGMKLDHVQLLPPHVAAGQDEAKVEEVKIKVQESMMTICADVENGICQIRRNLEAKKINVITGDGINPSVKAYQY